MASSRFEFALEKLTSDEWRLFEKLAAEFLIEEFPTLRTTATSSGDGGRDGFIQPDAGLPDTAIQISVSAKWRPKISNTLTKIDKNFPDTKRLVYVTNQSIGALGDEIRTKTWRDHNIVLDILDRSWFVEREMTNDQRATAAELLSTHIVDPLLSQRKVSSHLPTNMSAEESHIAVLHLALADIDAAGNKGLTKQCFETLVISSLCDSGPDNTLTHSEIEQKVSKVLPAGYEQKIDVEVTAAIRKLSKRSGPLKKQGITGSYYLSHVEQADIKARTEHFVREESAVKKELLDALERSGCNLDHFADHESLKSALLESLDSMLLKKGELFARSVASGSIRRSDVENVFGNWDRDKKFPDIDPSNVKSALITVVCQPSSVAHQHIQSISDAYTLFAFLRQTPDVQKTVLKIFSDGDLWLDTNIIIPALGEVIEGNQLARPYTSTLQAASAAGLKLYITEGVLEEVERHINRCHAYVRQRDTWHGTIPGLVGKYVAAGFAIETFNSWSELFAGPRRPLDDIAAYLLENHRIEVRNLHEFADEAQSNLRGSVQRFWFETHERRNKTHGRYFDPTVTDRMVAHDVENVVGIIEYRKKQTATPLGYRQWWLTDDRAAFRIAAHLKDDLQDYAPASPAIDPTFLSQLLRIGPLRTAVERDLKVNLPTILDFTRQSALPVDLLQQAASIRERYAGRPERIVARHVRDQLDEMREFSRPSSLREGYMKFQGTEGQLQSEADDDETDWI